MMSQIIYEPCHPEITHKIERNILPAQQHEELLALFKAIANDTRLKILLVLIQEELCVCDLSALLQMSKSAISHQLKYLYQLNIVDKRKEGRMVFYSISDEHVEDVLKDSIIHIQHSEGAV